MDCYALCYRWILNFISLQVTKAACFDNISLYLRQNGIGIELELERIFRHYRPCADGRKPQ